MFESMLGQIMGALGAMMIKMKPDDGLGSGGGFGVSNRKNSFLQNMHMADFVISLTRDRDKPEERFVKILKNRHTGSTGRADPETTIELCVRMIAMSIFGDTSLKLFRVDLEEAIKQTILEKIGDAHDPFQRESTGDGS